MNYVIISQDFENCPPEETDESNIDEFEESDHSSEFDLSDDSIEDKGFCDENDNYEDQFICDDEIEDDEAIANKGLFQPISCQETEILRSTSAFQQYHPSQVNFRQSENSGELTQFENQVRLTQLENEVKLVQLDNQVRLIQFDNQVKLNRFERISLGSESSLDSLSPFSSSPGSPMDPVQASSMFATFTSTKRNPNNNLNNGPNLTLSSPASTSLNSNMTVMSVMNSTDDYVLNSSALNLNCLNSVFRVYNRHDLPVLSSNLQPRISNQQREVDEFARNITKNSEFLILNNSESSLDSTGNSPSPIDLSDDELSDQFSLKPLIFTSTPPLCLRPIIRRVGGWGNPGARAPWGQTYTGASWVRTAWNPIFRQGRIRRYVRSGRGLFSSNNGRNSVIQRPSLDFEKMRKSSISRKPLHSGINKLHVNKVKNLRNSSYTSTQLLDPAIYSFRSLTLQRDLRSPSTTPLYRSVHSAPLISSEIFDDIMDVTRSKSASIDSVKNIEICDNFFLSADSVV